MSVYLVTGWRTVDAWPFAGEVEAESPDAAIAAARGWGVELEFVKDLDTGEIHLGQPELDPPDDAAAHEDAGL